MFRVLSLSLLISLAAFAQTPNATPKHAATDKSVSVAASSHNRVASPTDEGDSVPADKAVLTIHGVCNNAGSKAAADHGNCSSQMTKKQFERFIEALRSSGQMLPPTLAPAMRRTIAQNYVSILTNADRAARAGMDQDPKFQEEMRLARINFLAQAYRHHMEEESRKIPESQLHQYYEKNLGNFEQLTMLHLVLPRQNINDLDKLEKEGFEKLDTKNPPRTDLGAVRRGMYAPDQEKVLFALKPGEVSKVLEQPSALMIFKLVRRETLPFDQVKNEIVQTISNDKLDQATKALNESVQSDLDQNYFGPPPAERAGSNPHGDTPRN
jgi:PPIC-type PPIASE domain